MFIFVTCDVSPFAGFAWFLARAVLKIIVNYQYDNIANGMDELKILNI